MQDPYLPLRPLDHKLSRYKWQIDFNGFPVPGIWWKAAKMYVLRENSQVLNPHFWDEVIDE